jgi:hypothetical protein
MEIFLCGSLFEYNGRKISQYLNEYTCEEYESIFQINVVKEFTVVI